MKTQFRTPGADSGQEFFRVVGEQDEHAVLGRLFQNFQQGILAFNAQFLGKNVDLLAALVGHHIHIRPGIPDDFDRHGFMFRVIYGDAVWVIGGHYLTTGVAGKAGVLLPLAQDRRRKQPGKGVLAGADRSAEQIAMGRFSRAEGGGKPLFQVIISKKPGKFHTASLSAHPTP